MGRTLKNRDGMALIVTITVIALLTINVVSLFHTAWLQSVFAAGFRDETKAYFAARSGHTAAKKILIEDARKKIPLDTLSEEWSQGTIPIPFGDDYAFVSIRDEASKLDLNALVSQRGYPQEKMIKVFERLLGKLDLAKGLADSLVDWIDSNSEPRTAGAEDGYYASLKIPYRPKNNKLDSIEELLMVKGFDQKIINDLRPYITVWSLGKININTAVPLVIWALDDSITEEMVNGLVRMRMTKPFRVKEDIKKVPGMAQVFPRISLFIDVKSDYFFVESMATINENTKTIRSVYLRKGESLRPLYYKVF